MTPSLDRWTRGWRGPSLAALIALIAVLPGLLALPVTDGAEARLALASAQMLDDRDFTAAAVEDQAPDRQPLGVHWLQAAAVALTTPDTDTRRIWAYRLPAAAGVMIAAAACAWGGAALFGPATGFLAGALLGAGLLISTAGAIDAPGALTAGGVTLAIASLGRQRLAGEGGLRAGRRTRMLFWLGVALAALGGGPVGPVVVIMTGAALWVAERRAPWLAALGWGWGLILMAALVGPSVVAGVITGDSGLAPAWPDLGAGARTPGFQLLISPLLLFPFALVLPAGLLAARRAPHDAAVRLAVCWLIPAWLALEFAPGRSLAGGLLVYGALAWLCAVAVRDGIGPWAARIGAGLQLAAAAVLIALGLYAAYRFGDMAAKAWAMASAILVAGAALAGAALLQRGHARRALAVAGVLGVLAHGAALAGAAPQLHALWVSQRAASALAAAGLDPRAGVLPGPVALVGFGEPSLTFALGGLTDALTPEAAAQAVRNGRPAIVEASQEPGFLAALAPGQAHKAGEVDGFDYADRAPVQLMLYGPGQPTR